MKFSNGCWLNREGCTPSYPVQVYDYSIAGETLKFIAPANRVHNRGCTLGGVVLSYEISSPCDNVIRIKSYHYMDIYEVKPEFDIYESKANISIYEENGALVYTSGDTKLVIQINDFEMAMYYKDEKITSSSKRNAAYITTDFDDKSSYMREQMDMNVGEYIYGLGERFGSFIKNGQSVDIWNEDGGTSTEQSYKNIPFYVSNKNYGIFVNHPECVNFEIGSEKVSKIQFSVKGEVLDYFFIAGGSMKNVIENYTLITGKPSLPPAWTFGLWLSTSFTTSYDEKTVTSFIDGMAERDIPLRVFHFDCFWMKEFCWCDFEWDKRVFPNPKEMLARLKEKGLKICVWINPYIAQQSSLFAEAAKKGYLIKRADGRVWQWDLWQPGMGLVDFTNPDACKWFSGLLGDLVDMGVDSFKTDFGERIPTDCVYFDGSNTEKMHNYYTFLYNKVVYETLQNKLGKDNACLFARSATAGCQQLPVHWGGDSDSNYESMAESLRGGLSFVMSGFGFWSHDIGGFESTSTADVYKRWAAFGLLSSHSRLHGSSSYRVPWAYDEDASHVVRTFSKLKNKLMPYLFKTAVDTHKTGISVMRPMIIEFQNDMNCAYLDRQYMLGDNLLVAPIFNDKGVGRFYLPAGNESGKTINWTNFFTNETLCGGKWYEQHFDYTEIPLFVRENSIIAMGNNDSVPDYDYADHVTLNVYNLSDGADLTTTVYDTMGKESLIVNIKKTNGVLVVTKLFGDKDYEVVYIG